MSLNKINITIREQQKHQNRGVAYLLSKASTVYLADNGCPGVARSHAAVTRDGTVDAGAEGTAGQRGHTDWGRLADRGHVSAHRSPAKVEVQARCFRAED